MINLFAEVTIIFVGGGSRCVRIPEHVTESTSFILIQSRHQLQQSLVLTDSIQLS